MVMIDEQEIEQTEENAGHYNAAIEEAGGVKRGWRIKSSKQCSNGNFSINQQQHETAAI